jgi:hypothetical protein
MVNMHVTEMLIEARWREMERVDLARAEMMAVIEGTGGVRRAVAALLVRVAMVLDREVARGARELERRTA